MYYLYIKELESTEEISWLCSLPKWLQIWIGKILQKINIILKRKIEENRVMWLIPNICGKKVEQKIKRKLEKEEKQKWQIVLSKKIKQKQWNLKGYRKVEGKNILLCNFETILKTVLKEEPLELQDIYVLTNQYCEQNVIFIKKMAPKIKTMNIITKEIRKYSYLEKSMQEQGVAMCVANNKRKSLKKAKIVINLDFSKEEINQYVLFRNAILFNMAQEKIDLQGFEGIIVQDIEIEEKEKREWIKKNRLKEGFQQIEIYETLWEEKKQENLCISKLYGKNGEVSEKELRNWQKILTNKKN